VQVRECAPSRGSARVSTRRRARRLRGYPEGYPTQVRLVPALVTATRQGQSNAATGAGLTVPRRADCGLLTEYRRVTRQSRVHPVVTGITGPEVSCDRGSRGTDYVAVTLSQTAAPRDSNPHLTLRLKHYTSPLASRATP